MAAGKIGLRGRPCGCCPRRGFSFQYRLDRRGGIRVGELEASGPKTHAVPAGLLYGAAVYFFMNYLVPPLSAVAPATFQPGLFLNGVIGHALL